MTVTLREQEPSRVRDASRRPRLGPLARARHLFHFLFSAFTDRDRRARMSRWLFDAEFIGSRPMSLSELAAFTHQGHWVPGERHPGLEAVGRIYGWLVAIPVTTAGYALLWVVARWERLLLAIVLGVIVGLTW